jgi:hypothetical protein
MTRLTISVPDALAKRITAAAGGNVSGWMTKAARNALLAETSNAEAAWYASHPSYTDDAEAERHAA